MSDLLGYLLVASDPLLSSLGLQRRRSLYWSLYGQLQPQILGLLAEPRPCAAVVAEDADDGADSSDSSDDDNDTAAAASEARVEPADS